MTQQHVRYLPILEEGGLKAGVDFFVCFSPERLLMGRVIEDLRMIPRLPHDYEPD